MPNPTPAPTEVWSISGRVTAYGSNVGVSGAHVTADGATPADTDADGRYRLAYKFLPATPDIKVTVAGTGFMVRDFYVRYRAGARTALDTNLIRLAPPFSLEFYRQLVRDADDFPIPRPRSSGGCPRVQAFTCGPSTRPVKRSNRKCSISCCRRSVAAFGSGVAAHSPS